ncbi:hypothetical protein GGR58DRAFT_475929 [Xylaria digitata]|nr:hypothetical protein GGR58DRAFT_475929 [Xylaria digitata]
MSFTILLHHLMPLHLSNALRSPLLCTWYGPKVSPQFLPPFISHQHRHRPRHQSCLQHHLIPQPHIQHSLIQGLSKRTLNSYHRLVGRCVVVLCI